MKRIEWVPSQSIPTADGKAVEQRFTKFLLDSLDSYGEIKTVKQLREASKLAAKLEGAVEGQPIELEDSQFELLHAAVTFPRSLNVYVARHCMLFFDAVEAAK